MPVTVLGVYACILYVEEILKDELLSLQMKFSVLLMILFKRASYEPTRRVSRYWGKTLQMNGQGDMTLKSHHSTIAGWRGKVVN